MRGFDNNSRDYFERITAYRPRRCVKVDDTRELERRLALSPFVGRAGCINILEGIVTFPPRVGSIPLYSGDRDGLV